MAYSANGGEAGVVQMLVRAVLTAAFGAEVTRRIERVVEAVLGVFVVGLFLVLGIVFGDLRVVALMATVFAVIGLYVFRERLHVSTTVVRVVLIALIAVLFIGMRFVIAPPP
jgi:hypothetical protein